MERIDRSHDPVERRRLLLVHRRRLLCQGLEALFRQAAGWCHACSAIGVHEGIRRAARFRPDVVLIDLGLLSGGAAAAAREIRSRCVWARLVFLDETFHEARLRMVLGLGGKGYFTQDDSFETLAAGIQRVALGGSAFSPAAEPHLVRVGDKLRWEGPDSETALAKLTRRELEILVLLAQGLSVKRCAEQLGVAPSTADNHKSRLMRKLGVHKAVDLVHVAIREGIFPEHPG